MTDNEITVLVEETIKECLNIDTLVATDTVSMHGADSLDLMQILVDLDDRVKKLHGECPALYNSFSAMKEKHGGDVGRLTPQEIAVHIQSVLDRRTVNTGVNNDLGSRREAVG